MQNSEKNKPPLTKREEELFDLIEFMLKEMKAMVETIEEKIRDVE